MADKIIITKANFGFGGQQQFSITLNVYLLEYMLAIIATSKHKHMIF